MEKDMDNQALNKIGYGLYVVTSNDGNRDNGLIVNTVSQITDSPKRVMVAINKANYSHDVIKKSGIMNVNCLTIETPFSVFEKFGFQSGRDVDKFAGEEVVRTENGLAYLKEYANAVISLKVEQYVDVETHGMFICQVVDAKVLSEKESVTYDYYHKNIKPSPQAIEKKGYVCKICGYVYEGEELPEDFICPWCKHGVEDFEVLV
ncbi:MAG: hypothetical protein E7262_02400 [Lachnospiraceae bacterium]|nr:hypothetical protein [Lachnospiraceae bacterium]